MYVVFFYVTCWDPALWSYFWSGCVLLGGKCYFTDDEEKKDDDEEDDSAAYVKLDKGGRRRQWREVLITTLKSLAGRQGNVWQDMGEVKSRLGCCWRQPETSARLQWWIWERLHLHTSSLQDASSTLGVERSPVKFQVASEKTGMNTLHQDMRCW